jgi:hypothetical protein
MKKAMRRYDPGRIICPVCGKPILLSQATVFVEEGYRHATNCVAPPSRQAYADRVAAKRAARRDMV